VCRSNRLHIIGVNVSDMIADTTTAKEPNASNLAEHPPDDAGHEQQRNEHGDQ
jgi:hypothetical protein